MLLAKANQFRANHNLPLATVPGKPGQGGPATGGRAQSCCPPALQLKPAAHPLAGRPQTPPPAIELSDSNIFWMNSRPYWIHGTLGRGGFGSVYKVEMLIPFGMEVARDSSSGALLFDEDGAVCVCRGTSTSSGEEAMIQDSPRRRPPHSPQASGLAPPSNLFPPNEKQDVVDLAVERQSISRALMVSQTAPASMCFSSPGLTIPENQKVVQAAGFFRVTSSTEEEPLLTRDDGCDTESANEYFRGASAEGAVVQRQSGDSETTNSTDVFDVRAGRFVHGSGVFFALKIQGGQDNHQMNLFLREVEQLRQLQGK